MIERTQRRHAPRHDAPPLLRYEGVIRGAAGPCDALQARRQRFEYEREAIATASDVTNEDYEHANS